MQLCLPPEEFSCVLVDYLQRLGGKESAREAATERRAVLNLAMRERPIEQ